MCGGVPEADQDHGGGAEELLVSLVASEQSWVAKWWGSTYGVFQNSGCNSFMSHRIHGVGGNQDFFFL